jgi:peroxiredoxin
MKSKKNDICLVASAGKSLAMSIVLSLCTGMVTASANDRAGDFALLDHNGKFHQLSYYGDYKAVVIAAQDLTGTDLTDHAKILGQASSALAKEDVKFFFLNPQPKDTRDAIAERAKQLNLDIAILLDQSQLVAETLGITRYGEAVIVDADSMKILYRGDTASVGQVLPALLSGAEADNAQLSGRAIDFSVKDAHAHATVSYTKEIVPILQENCVSCHHDGAIGPWSMSSHAMVRGWSPMMREVVMTRRMPPGQIDSHVGKKIAEVAGLTIAEKQKLIHWIDAGAPMGDGIDPLPQMTFNDTKFSLGEPDMVFAVPAQGIPATGVVDYRYVPVELKLDRDVWIRAMEFVPGDREVLHHVIAYLSSPADKSGSGQNQAAERGDNIGGFAPGRQPDEFRDNSGRFIPKGSNLLLQMHYTTSGRETVDATEVGLFIHDKPPAFVMSGGVAGQRRFMVPPGAKEHMLRGEQLIERDAYLYEMTPHMHFRGKHMSYSVEYPDGKIESLLSVPKYDFNWQFNYRLEEPLFLPAGSKLIAIGAMDNSSRNLGNPDPTKPVFFGLQTMHEMFFGFTTLRYDGDTPNQSRQTPSIADESVAGLE